jgi:hypothetical protein
VRILIFQPFSGIWDHSLLEFQLAKILGKRQFEITIVNCGGVFKGICAVRQNYGMSLTSNHEQMIQLCRKCKVASDMGLQANPKMVRIVMGDRFKSDSENVWESEEIFKPNSEILLDQIQKSEVRATLYELILKFKKRDLILSEEEAKYLNDAIANYRISKQLSERILDENDFDAVLIYNPQYAINTAMAEAANKRGVRVYYTSATGSLSEMKTTLRIYDWFKFLLRDPALTKWNLNRDIASKSDLVRIRRHQKLSQKATSAFTYSARARGQSVRAKFGIDQRKIFLLAMSSYDEYSAAKIATLFPTEMTESEVFKDQTAWLKFTIQWFSKLNDTALIIRPHPREIPNKRDSQSAPVNLEFEAVLKNLPANVYLDDPNDKFSLYDHFREIDGVLVSWSNVGLESLMHGIPVVGYDKNLCAYPESLYLTGQSLSTYESNLQLLLDTPRSPTIAQSANNWFAFSNLKNALFLGGPIEKRFPLKFLPFAQGVFYRLRRKFTKTMYWLDLHFPPPHKPLTNLESLLKGDQDSLI